MRRLTVMTALIGALSVLWATSALAGTGIGSPVGDTDCGIDAVIFETGVH